MKRIMTMVFVGVFLFCGIVNAEIIYFENFETDPGYALLSGPDGHDYYWDSASGSYVVRHNYDENSVYRYVMSPKFEMVEDTSFSIMVDLKPVRTSWGQGISIVFGESASNNGILFNAENTGGFSFYYPAAPGEGRTYAPAMPRDVWYTLGMNYDYSSGTAALFIKNRDTAEFLFEDTVNVFDYSFDQVFLGGFMANSEGSGAEMHYDNILIETPSAVPEPTTMLLLSTGVILLSGTRRSFKLPSF